MIRKNGKVYCDSCGSKIAHCIYYRIIAGTFYHFCDAVCSTRWHEKNKEKIQ